VVYQNAGVILDSFSKKVTEALNSAIVDFSQKRIKPVVVILPPGSAETRRLEMEHSLARAGVPVFPSIERLAKAISNVNRYCRFRAQG
jgi:acyl-CoA synthetase (NDP forming)